MKSARRKLRIYEVPISYHGRTYEEGKKIGWKDGLKAFAVIVKFRLITGPFSRRTTHTECFRVIAHPIGRQFETGHFRRNVRTMPTDRFAFQAAPDR